MATAAEETGRLFEWRNVAATTLCCDYWCEHQRLNLSNNFLTCCVNEWSSTVQTVAQKNWWQRDPRDEQFNPVSTKLFKATELVVQRDSDLLHNLKDSSLSPSYIALPSLKSQQSPQTNRQTNRTVITTSSLAEVKINVLHCGWSIAVVLQVEREEEKRMLLSELNWEIKAWRDVRELGALMARLLKD